MLNTKWLSRHHIPKPLIGDWFVIVLSILLVAYCFKTFWHNEKATIVRIRAGHEIFATLSLNQIRKVIVPGTLGESHILISNGKARFESSPCNTQYCVHQGWLSKAGQIAICLPNQVSLQLIGAENKYDSLNY